MGELSSGVAQSVFMFFVETGYSPNTVASTPFCLLQEMPRNIKKLIQLASFLVTTIFLVK